MSVVAAAVIGSAVVGGVVASSSASKAAKAQQNAADTASATELEMFDRNAELTKPWREAGAGALSQLTAGTQPGGDYMRDFTLGDFWKDPGYQFRMDEGLKGVEASAAARGGALSGGALKDVARFGSDYASNEFSNAYSRFNADRDRRFNRLSGIAGTGQTATQQTANQGAQVASNVAQNQLQAGNSRASGYVATGNAINQGIGTIGNWYQQQAMQPAAANNSSWGSPGMNNFFYGNGGVGD